LQVPSRSLQVEVTPLVADQELRLSVDYWEGAVQFHGHAGGSRVDGRGYVELVGYK
jgi:predicted secreted hydrolase